MTTGGEMLLAEVMAFCKRTGMKPTNFGLAIGAGKGFFPHLRDGRVQQPSQEKIDRVRRFMASYTADP